ncbi:MAG: hypothetical protein GXP06_10650 [Alphaproteobacteria bacterium]|nr:hypothetical protein [Alphaproteobacteria bacterium]
MISRKNRSAVILRYRAIREEAEAAALAEVDAELEVRRRKSDELRRLRLAQVAE